MSLQPHLLVCLCSSSSIHLHQQPQSPSLACYISIPRSLFPISYDLDTALSILNCRSVHLHMSPSICPVLYMFLQQLSTSPSALSISTELFQSSSLGLYTSISLSTFLKSPTSICSSPTHPPPISNSVHLPAAFLSRRLAVERFKASGYTLCQ